ncbi:flagellar FlbD family protein [Paenibacillus sp. ACRRX]|uniref:flagellar FlbD family protein n=1 Tax=Paenibacillus TaxID=44249 RepID=UPI0003FC54F2|nr:MULTISPECIES: flagellar FlbD family protein [Paenibacillus]MCG7407488.1 flagellar FlbD family protein [Paenibacillus sp. ACRRX]MDK8180724.1 flagellar FlbD family protein [Paenibacillus sp. UMB4589-SE434]
MIQVTRLNGSSVWVNALLVEAVEETPDTYITLFNGKKLIVLEKAPEIIRLITEYIQKVGAVGGTIKLQSTEGQS